MKKTKFLRSKNLLKSLNGEWVTGFTLIEMVITITLVVILSTISVPIYKDYIYKARLAEGYSLFGIIRDAQLRYYNEYGNFVSEADCSSIANRYGVTCHNEVLGIDARANKYFTLFNACIYHPGAGEMNKMKQGFVAYIKEKNDQRTKNMTFLLTGPTEYSGF